MTILTSKVNSIDDMAFLRKFLTNFCDARQKQRVILVYEVYIKPAILCQRGTISGKPVSNQDKLVTVVLSYMINSLFGGPELLSKVLPATKLLNTEFQFEDCQLIMEVIKEVKNGKLLTILTDGNKIDQCFFRISNAISIKLWLTEGNIFFLFYECVYIIKCIRNNCSTEKISELEFINNTKTYVARWT